MTFVYPAVFTPHEKDSGFHAFFPDLECCEADGPDLEDAIENARDAAHNWIQVELDEFEGDLPFASHEEDIVLKEGQFIRKISVTIKLLQTAIDACFWLRMKREAGIKSADGAVIK